MIRQPVKFHAGTAIAVTGAARVITETFWVIFHTFRDFKSYLLNPGRMIPFVQNFFIHIIYLRKVVCIHRARRVRWKRPRRSRGSEQDVYR